MKNKRPVRKTHNGRGQELFFGIDKKPFIMSCAKEQTVFTRQGEEIRVRELITYVICRIKERMKEGPRVPEDAQW